MFLCSVFALRFTKTKTDIHYKLKILWRAVVETLPLMLVVLQIISDTTRINSREVQGLSGTDRGYQIRHKILAEEVIAEYQTLINLTKREFV